MRRAVDAACKARHHSEALCRQCIGEIARKLYRRRARIARAYHGHAGFRRQCQIATKGQDRRRTFDLTQQRGIARLVVEEVLRTRLADGLDLALDFSDRRGAVLPPAFEMSGSASRAVLAEPNRWRRCA